MSNFVYCRGCAKQIHETAPTCPQCGAPQLAAAAHSTALGAANAHDPEGNVVRQIADYERICGYLWIVLGAIQIITIVGVIAGVWNIFAGRSRLKAVPIILARSPDVLPMFDDVSGLVVIGILNFFLGGVIGIVFVAFDFFIRDKVLSHRQLFAAVRAHNFADTLPLQA